MKTLLICGSPRKGNTEYVLEQIYSKLDCEKEMVLLRDQRIEHCKGCLACHSKNGCYINDGMKTITNKMQKSDMLVIGVPNYFDNVTSIFKTFADRCYSLYKSEKLKNKKVYFIFVGGGNIEGTKENMLNSVHGFIKYLKLNFIGEKSFKALNVFDLKNELINKDFDLIIDVIKQSLTSNR